MLPFHLLYTLSFLVAFAHCVIYPIRRSTSQALHKRIQLDKGALAYVDPSASTILIKRKKKGNDNSADDDPLPHGVVREATYVVADVTAAKQLDAGTLTLHDFLEDQIVNVWTPACDKALYNYPTSDPSHTFDLIDGRSADDVTAKLGIKYLYVLDMVCDFVKHTNGTVHTSDQLLKSYTQDLANSLGWDLPSAKVKAAQTQAQLGTSGNGGKSGSGGSGGTGSNGGKPKGGKPKGGKGPPTH